MAEVGRDIVTEMVARARDFQKYVDDLQADDRLRPVIRVKHIEEHTVTQLAFPSSGWLFTRTGTGTVRVQKGDFNAYLTETEATTLAAFLTDTDPGFD